MENNESDAFKPIITVKQKSEYPPTDGKNIIYRRNCRRRIVFIQRKSFTFMSFKKVKLGFLISSKKNDYVHFSHAVKYDELQ
jgi:hypothetical protein